MARPSARITAWPAPPNTKPNWSGGRYSVLVEDELVGYFRLFTSAHKWATYLALMSNAGTRIAILDKGSIVNIRTAGQAEATL